MRERLILLLTKIIGWIKGEPTIILDERPKDYEEFNRENVKWK